MPIAYQKSNWTGDFVILCDSVIWGWFRKGNPKGKLQSTNASTPPKSLKTRATPLMIAWQATCYIAQNYFTVQLQQMIPAAHQNPRQHPSHTVLLHHFLKRYSDGSYQSSTSLLCSLRISSINWFAHILLPFLVLSYSNLTTQTSGSMSHCRSNVLICCILPLPRRHSGDKNLTGSTRI